MGGVHRGTGASSLSVPVVLSACRPRDAVSQGVTEVDHGGVEGLLVDSGPEFQLISVAVTFVAVVALAPQVDGERSSAGRGGAVNGARAVELIASTGDGLEAE